MHATPATDGPRAERIFRFMAAHATDEIHIRVDLAFLTNQIANAGTHAGDPA